MSAKPVLPGPYPIKIVTRNSDETLVAILNTVREHYPDYDVEKTKQNLSKGNQYVSTTVTIYAESEEQLKKLHQALMKVPDVIMVL